MHDKQEDQITHFPQYVSDMQPNICLNVVAGSDYVSPFYQISEKWYSTQH